MSAVAYIVIAILLAGVFTYLVAGRVGNSIDLDKARSSMALLDMEAFRNLVDPEEDAFLQSCLPPDQFTAIKRERAWAAIAYTRALAQVALEFSRFGHALRRSPDPNLADLGRQIVSGAVRLRILTLKATGRLFIAASFPKFPQRNPRSLFEQYGQSAGLLARYGALERARKQVS
jgi:hypothetical protein